MRGPSSELLGSLERFPGAIATLFLSSRQAVLTIAPECSELVNDVGYTIAVNFTFTHSFANAFAHVTAYKDHVNLGFNRGAELDDPMSRLKGDGVSVRHLSLRSEADLNDPYTMTLLQQAADQAYRPLEALEPLTIVKGPAT